MPSHVAVATLGDVARAAVPGWSGSTFRVRENFESLMRDLQRKVFDRRTTLGAEQPSIPEWWERGW